jgi:hypothetical protein
MNFSENIYMYGATFILIAIVLVFISQRKRIKRVETKLGIDGIEFTFELSELVKKEVTRVSLASLNRIAKMDRELIDFWENEKNLSSGESAKRLKMAKAEISNLEEKLEKAVAEDKFHIANQLREMYLKHLQFSRQHFGAGGEYSAIRAYTIEGLKRIEELENGNAVRQIRHS